MSVTYLRSPKLLAAGGFTVVVLWVSSAGASSANISRSYETTTKIANGNLVSLDAAHSSAVVLANNTNGSRLVGVAVGNSDSLLAVNVTAGNVQVATSGTVTALVSDLSGDIKVGDQVGISPFNGLGAEAEVGGRVIGLAQTPFSAQTKGAHQETVTTRSGHTRQINVGYIKLHIGIGTATTAGGQAELNSLQRLGRSLTGHTISTTRVIISLVIAVMALAALITLIYASIFSGIISVGRNPLAKESIFRTVATVLGMAVILGFISTLTIFLILR